MVNELILLDYKAKKLSYGFLLAEIIAFLVLLSIGAWLQPDSPGYITGGITRSAMYPLILKGYMAVMGSNFSLLVAMQLLLGFASVHYAVRLFAGLFDLNFYAKAVVALFFFMPYIGSLIGNTILTEPICYPFFIFALGEIIKGLVHKDYTNLIAGMVWTGLLVLTRRQFIFLYPLIAIALIYIFAKYRFFAGKYIALGMFFVTIVGASVLEKSYHYVYHGAYADVPFTGFQLVNAPIFASKKSDADLFTDPDEKQLFISVYDQMEKNGYLMSQDTNPNMPYYIPYYQKYYAVYTTICYGFIAKALGEMKIRDPFKVDKMLVSMSLKLILANPIPYIKVIAQNAIQNVGGYYVCMLLAFILLFTFVNSLKSDCDKSLLFFIILITHLGNVTLITLVEPMLRRYTMYTEIFVYSLIVCSLIVYFNTFCKAKQIMNK